jgi:DNA replication protein DnaC
MEIFKGLPSFDILKDLEEMEIIKEESLDVLCEKHGIFKGIIQTRKNGGKIYSECPKCKAEREAEIAEREKLNAERKEAERISKNVQEGNIEIDYQSLTFEDYRTETPQQKRALEAVQDLMQGKKKKVVLLGETGLGKTMLGSLAVKYMGGKIYRQYDIATMIRQSYSFNAKKTELEIVEELSSIPLLVIDEVGKVGNSEAVRNWFSAIIDKRHTRKLPLMLCGNLHFKQMCKNKGCPECFENYFGNDVLSRLSQDTTIVIVKGKDERNLVNYNLYY